MSYHGNSSTYIQKRRPKRVHKSFVTLNPSNEIMKQPLSKIKFAASLPKLDVASGFVCSIMRTCNSAWRIVPLSKDWNMSTLVHAWWEDRKHTWRPSFAGIYKMSKLKVHNWLPIESYSEITPNILA